MNIFIRTKTAANRAVNDPSGRRSADRPADGTASPVHRTVGEASQTGRSRPGFAARLLIFVCILPGVLFASGVLAQKADDAKKPDIAKPAAQSTSVAQLKVEFTGDFAYRFVAKNGESAAPTPLPSPTGGMVALPLPATIKPDGATLEVFDNQRGNTARLPVSLDKPATLNESAFKFAQAVYVPLQSKGRPVMEAQIEAENAAKTYHQTKILSAADNGVARFENVPLDEPITLTARYSADSPKSVTETFSRAHPADGIHHEPITVDWADVKTVPAPAVAANPNPPVASATGTVAPVAAPPVAPAAPPAGNNALGTILGLLVIAGAGYGLYRLYNTGQLKTILDKAGIQIAAPIADGGGANPFTASAAPKLTPITEGTAEPFGGVSAVVGAGSNVGAGPRLVATAGTYSGQIFPLNSASADIGRDPMNPIPLPNDTNVSRRHAAIQGGGGQYAVIDFGSSNGTYVNGVKIGAQTPQPLRPGDELNIGNTRFRFEA